MEETHHNVGSEKENYRLPSVLLPFWVSLVGF